MNWMKLKNQNKMEGKGFLKVFVHKILELFIRNWEGLFIKIWKKVPHGLQKELNIIVKVVENIKRVVDSPVADMITAIIPGEADDRMKEWLREVLPKIIATYHARSGIKESDCYHNIATNLTKELTGMSYGQSAVTIEMAYQNLKLNP